MPSTWQPDAIGVRDTICTTRIDYRWIFNRDQLPEPDIMRDIQSQMSTIYGKVAHKETGYVSLCAYPVINPACLLAAGVRDGNRGAMYFVDEQGESYSKGRGPETSVVYDQDDYSPYCEVALETIRAAIVEFFQTGTKSISVEWQTKVPPTKMASET
ncbi:MAG: Imm1 family immunity protein [Actinomycetota bacterium]|nr:Imm1 family immunity protein [Actinomycetota bacterium]